MLCIHSTQNTSLTLFVLLVASLLLPPLPRFPFCHLFVNLRSRTHLSLSPTGELPPSTGAVEDVPRVQATGCRWPLDPQGHLVAVVAQLVMLLLVLLALVVVTPLRPSSLCAAPSLRESTGLGAARRAGGLSSATPTRCVCVWAWWWWCVWVFVGCLAVNMRPAGVPGMCWRYKSPL